MMNISRNKQNLSIKHDVILAELTPKFESERINHPKTAVLVKGWDSGEREGGERNSINEHQILLKKFFICGTTIDMPTRLFVK